MKKDNHTLVDLEYFAIFPTFVCFHTLSQFRQFEDGGECLCVKTIQLFHDFFSHLIFLTLSATINFLACEEQPLGSEKTSSSSKKNGSGSEESSEEIDASSEERSEKPQDSIQAILGAIKVDAKVSAAEIAMHTTEGFFSCC